MLLVNSQQLTSAILCFELIWNPLDWSKFSNVFGLVLVGDTSLFILASQWTYEYTYMGEDNTFVGLDKHLRLYFLYIKGSVWDRCEVDFFDIEAHFQK